MIRLSPPLGSRGLVGRWLGFTVRYAPDSLGAQFGAASLRGADGAGVVMLSWFQALMPKEEKFFDLFIRHADTLCPAAELSENCWKEAPPSPRAAPGS